MKRAALLGVVATLATFPSDAFDVRWNGKPLKVHPARVSAYPLNQVWAGKQRPVEQSTLAAFVTFDMAEAGELRVVPDAAERGGEMVILPLSDHPKVKAADGGCVMRIERPRQFVVSFGTDSPPLHVFANPPFAAVRGEDDIVFGPGEHDVGVVVPKSGQTVRIEEGAVVYGSIFIAHATDVKIVGRGIVDGSRLKRADRTSKVHAQALAAGLPEGFYGADMAVTTFTAAWSTNVVVEGVTFRDPPRWSMIVRAGCQGVTIDNVKIIGCWRYNSDGINVCASENVAVRNSFLRTFDDCLVARGAYLDCDGPITRNVTAENCVLWCDWGKCLEVWAGHKPCLIENVRYGKMACVHPSGIVCDVTTWFASSDTRIRNVVFEDIEIDFAGKLYKEQLQNRADDTFRYVPRKRQVVLNADCGRYGRYLGNQHHEPATDLSGFRVRYENLTFRRIECLGNVPELRGRIDASSAPHTIEGVTLYELPDALDVKTSGL